MRRVAQVHHYKKQLVACNLIAIADLKHHGLRTAQLCHMPQKSVMTGCSGDIARFCNSRKTPDLGCEQYTSQCGGLLLGRTAPESTPIRKASVANQQRLASTAFDWFDHQMADATPGTSSSRPNTLCSI